MKNKYIVRETIKINRHIVFLCGAFYEHKITDKRFILRKFILSNYGNCVFPLIVDNFLNQDVSENDLFSIEEYEELISNISSVNFIFLESFSSASELGLFSNSLSFANNVVFYPDNSNLILDKVGYFLKAGVLRNNKNNITEKKYVALVERYAYGTDFVDEHYYFENNKLPSDLERTINEKMDELRHKEYSLNFDHCDVLPNKLQFFTFYILNNIKKIVISSRTAFYMLYSLVMRGKTYNDMLCIDAINVSEQYLEELKEIVCSTILFRDDQNVYSYEIYVDRFKPLKDFIICSLLFIKYLSIDIFNKKITKSNLLAIFDEIYESIGTHQKLEEKIIKLPPKLAVKNKKSLVRQFPIFKNRKTRIITTYLEPGNELNRIHESASKCLGDFCLEYGLYSDNSFAYKKGLNTLKCVGNHIQSKHFLKLDISNFFESIKFDVIYDIISNKVESIKYYSILNDKEKKKFNIKIQKMLRTLTYHGKFLVGFVSSPIISEICLNEFDKELSRYCDSNGIIYTRYADDILLSSPNVFVRDDVINFVISNLEKYKLTLNQEKTKFISLNKQGDYINFLGLNIVYGECLNKISIGRSYVKRLAKLKIYGSKDKYTLNKIKGMEGYLLYNDKNSYNKYLRLIKLYNENK